MPIRKGDLVMKPGEFPKFQKYDALPGAPARSAPAARVRAGVEPRGNGDDIDEILVLRKRLTTTVNADIRMMEAALKQVKAPKDYLRALEYTVFPPSKAMVEARSALVIRTLPLYLGTKPKGWDYREFLNIFPKLESDLTAVAGKTAIRKANSCVTSMAIEVRQLLRR